MVHTDLPRCAVHQAELATHGKKTSRRLQDYDHMRRLWRIHAIDTMAKRMAAVCRLPKVGEVVIGWPKGIVLDTTANVHCSACGMASRHAQRSPPG
jgi:hypothetical protein